MRLLRRPARALLIKLTPCPQEYSTGLFCSRWEDAQLLHHPAALSSSSVSQTRKSIPPYWHQISVVG